MLDDRYLVDLAWYHTSPHLGWPLSSRTVSPETMEAWKRVLPTSQAGRERIRYENQALHLGTYETAIESMLRRMHDQSDGATDFYLYRVELRRDLVVEPGWRDENFAAAAQISQASLGAADAIRYLNVYESPGSISFVGGS